MYICTCIFPTQPRDPCPSYPVISYIINITETFTNNFLMSVNIGNSFLVLNDTHGLVPDQVYRLVIEVGNIVGRTLSEDILLCKFVFHGIV